MLHLDDYRRLAKEIEALEEKYKKGLITKEEFDELYSQRYASEKDNDDYTR